MKTEKILGNRYVFDTYDAAGVEHLKVGPVNHDELGYVVVSF
jgi:hypothetical protein